MISYGQLHELVRDCQSRFEELKISKGSRVLVAVPMSTELYGVLLALLSLGAISVFLDPWLTGSQMNRVIRRIQPDLLVMTPKIRRFAWLIPAVWQIKSKWTVRRLTPQTGEWSDVALHDNETALVTFTSGTSGNPKGANRTYGFLHAQLQALQSHLQQPEPTVDVTNFPIVGLADLAYGNTVVVPSIHLMKIHTGNISALDLGLRKAEAHRLIVSPAILARLVPYWKNHGIPSTIREILTGGAPISYRLMEQCISDFPGLHFEAIYGSTEAEPIATCSFESALPHMNDPVKGVFVGRPVPEIEWEIMTPLDGPADAGYLVSNVCKDGQPGEIVVSGEHVNRSYYEDPAAFVQNKIQDGVKIWHRTGDIGYSENGNLFLVGRHHRMMKHNGKMLHPYPAEALAERHFQLSDVGYVQRTDGSMVFCVGSAQRCDEIRLQKLLEQSGFPVHEMKFFRNPLPREPRHRSKLELDLLRRML